VSNEFAAGSPRPADEILTVGEVAELLKVRVTWVYEHSRPRCRQPLPSFKMGKYLRFRAQDIQTYVDSLSLPSTI
jgi:predicted DNA-binding transcriptional regulator AlpA